MLVVVVIGVFSVNELKEVSFFLLRCFMMQRPRYALGYPCLISMLLIFMNRFDFKQPEILGSIVGQKKFHLYSSLF